VPLCDSNFLFLPQQVRTSPCISFSVISSSFPLRAPQNRFFPIFPPFFSVETRDFLSSDGLTLPVLPSIFLLTATSNSNFVFYSNHCPFIFTLCPLGLSGFLHTVLTSQQCFPRRKCVFLSCIWDSPACFTRPHFFFLSFLLASLSFILTPVPLDKRTRRFTKFRYPSVPPTLYTFLHVFSFIPFPRNPPLSSACPWSDSASLVRFSLFPFWMRSDNWFLIENSNSSCPPREVFQFHICFSFFLRFLVTIVLSLSVMPFCGLGLLLFCCFYLPLTRTSSKDWDAVRNFKRPPKSGSPLPI